MLRAVIALACAGAAPVAGWFGMWALMLVPWMPSITPADMAWRWVVAILALACLAVALAMFVVVVALLSRPLRAGYRWLSEGARQK